MAREGGLAAIVRFLLVLAAAAGLTILATTPPAPRPADAPAQDFSAARAMRDVAAISAAPHPTGTAENARVRAYLTARMAALGMEVSTRTAALDARGLKRLRQWSGDSQANPPLVNLIGVLPGQDRQAPAILLMAHHDTVWGSPGAADDTAGVASLLETVRALKARGTPHRDIIVLLTDGEELGLEGARAFFAGDPLLARIGAVVNVEARGGGGRTTLFQTGKGNGAAVALFARAVARPAGTSLSAYVYSVLPNNTDLTEALPGPWPAYNFAFIGRPGLYHSPMATPARLDQGAVQDMGAQVLALTAALDAATPMPPRAPDVVFFDLFGLATLVYPAWLGWLMLGGAALALGWAARGTTGIGRGALRMLGLIGAAAVGLALLNLLALAGTGANYYDRLAAIPVIEVMAAGWSLAALLVFLGTRPPGRGATAGAALPLLALALVAQALAPTAAYLLVLPLTLLALTLAAQRRGGALADIVATLGAIFTAATMLTMAHLLLQGVGPDFPGTAALPLALMAMALMPVWPGLNARAGRMATLALLGLALGATLWLHTHPLAASAAVYAKRG
ncbi:MAG: M20/M25/M40 family metallo-hydrolase [Proteobacteria bacterium]|nr:M20/M25/M40 family metallo-hydrolase [Pseudomonadota bacterium]